MLLQYKVNERGTVLETKPINILVAVFPAYREKKEEKLLNLQCYEMNQRLSTNDNETNKLNLFSETRGKLGMNIHRHQRSIC